MDNEEQILDALAGEFGPEEQILAFAMLWQRMHAHMRTWRLAVNACLPLMEASPEARKELFALCLSANHICRDLDRYGNFLVNLKPKEPEKTETREVTVH